MVTGWGSGEHEGWSGGIAPDGRITVGARGANLLLGDGSEVAEDAVTGWQAACSCGWCGPVWTRAAAPDQDDRTERIVYLPDGDPGEVLEAALHDEWRDHVASFDADPVVADITAAAREVEAARRRLDTAVAAARTAGASWEAIGTAAGITRQSAHERWHRLG